MAVAGKLDANLKKLYGTNPLQQRRAQPCLLPAVSSALLPYGRCRLVVRIAALCCAVDWGGCTALCCAALRSAVECVLLSCGQCREMRALCCLLVDCCRQDARSELEYRQAARLRQVLSAPACFSLLFGALFCWIGSDFWLVGCHTKNSLTLCFGRRTTDATR